MPKYDFLVVGSSTVDLFVRTRHIERIDISGHMDNEAAVERLVCINFGSKTDLESLEIFPGGSAANSAVAMQHLGSETALLSCIGRDQFGNTALADLERHGVNTSPVVVNSSSGTGVGLNITTPSGEKSVLVHRGANDLLGPEHLKESIVRESRNIFVTSLVSENNFALFLKLVKLARKHSRRVVFAPSISMLRRWLPQLLKVQAGFSLSIFNHEEGSFYTGKDRLKEILKRLPGNVSVLSKDVEGAYAREGSSFFHVKTLPVKISDTCGAGDAFSGAFAHFYSHGEKGSVGGALANAVGVAALKVATKGSRMDSSSRRIASFLAENRSKLKVQKV